MRPFLLVGCGGSGGVTLQFLIDQLQADLSAHGFDKVPDAWQFVHVDVPVKPDGVRAGLPPVVPASPNGAYVGLAPPAGSYHSLAGALARQLMSEGQGAQLATWYSDPSRVAVPVAEGAGQRRMVGRVVTLSRLRTVRDGLTTAFRRLNAPGVREQLRTVASRVSPGTEHQAEAPPVIIVVSSMAGGAGASMVLDVCRVLSQQDGVDPAATGLFLYTPEVFESLAPEDRQGVPGNALAMLGELVAAQLGAAAADDQAIYEAAGLGRARPGRAAPFGRVFPIGGKVGATGTPFGGGRPDEIYRGVGRGLSALMLSGRATQEWMGFDLANGKAVPVDSTDFGWAADPNDLQWGSFGYAQLSMGRDRYAEYAAQRIARAGVLRLVVGHRQVGDSRTDQEQRDRLVQERLPRFQADLGLPDVGQSVEDWFDRLFAVPASDSAQALVRDHLERWLTDGLGQPAAQWLPQVLHSISLRSADVNAGARAAAYRSVHAWYEKALTTVESAVELAVATYGIPTTVELLTRVDTALASIVHEMQLEAPGLLRDATALPKDVADRVRAVRGAIDPHSGPVQLLREGYVRACQDAVLGETLALLADVVAAFRTDLLGAIRTACTDSYRSLDLALRSKTTDTSAAALRTDEVVQWPVDGQAVPARFKHAQNEVLLVDANDFQATFDDHVRRTMDLPDRRVTTAVDALSLAAREVVLNAWPTAGAAPSSGLLERRARWRPSRLANDPATGEPMMSQRGQYRLAADPAEVLDRARAWVGRPKQPLQAYIDTSMRDYLSSDELGASVQEERLQEVSRKFRETLQLAQPLVAVDAELVSAVHGGFEARVAFKFGEVPFEGLPVAAVLRQHLVQSDAHDVSAAHFDNASRAMSSATKIDVFGSYPPLAPIVFTSLLAPLASGWAEAVLPGARASFWTGRRSRRLAGAVPMTELHRRSLLAGWYVARATGRLRLPGEGANVRAVEVWDDTDGVWRAFPHPLIVPKTQLELSLNAYMPAVLLSYGLAAAQATALRHLEPLRPYTVLRGYWDDRDGGSDEPTHPDVLPTAAVRHLSAYFEQPHDLPRGAPDKAAARTGEASKDIRAYMRKLAEHQHAIGTDYLRAEDGGPEGGGRWSSLSRSDELWSVPLFHEVADDVYWAHGRLLEVLERCLRQSDREQELV